MSKKLSDIKVNNQNLHICKSTLLLRDVPCEVIQIINRKKLEILNNNSGRTFVSNSEAIYKIILQLQQ